MRLIDKSIIYIISGYDEVIKAEIKLRQHWRPKLLAAYTRRKTALELTTTSSNRKKIPTIISISLGIGFLLIGIGFTCRGFNQDVESILWNTCGGPLLFLFGSLILGASLLTLRSSNSSKKQRIPLHPFRNNYHQKGIYPDIRTTWMEGLCGDLKDEVPDYPEYFDKNDKDHGAQGERLFILRLQEIFDDQSYLLARVMQRPKEDIDVIVISSRGIWVFEVKHWSGEIYWDDQGWRRVQTYYKRGGVEITKQPEIRESPDQQWIRAAAQVSRTLHDQASEILERYPTLERIRGGIVFTKEDAILKISPNRSVYWGKHNFWIKTLTNIEPKINLDTRSTLKLIEIFLVRHQELAPSSEMRSMKSYAQGIIQDAEKQLYRWIKS